MTRFSLTCKKKKSICLFVYKDQWVKCVVKVLYTKRKVSFTGLTNLRSKWAECEVKWVWHPWCKWSGYFTHCRIKYGSVIPLPPRGITQTLLEAYLPYWIGSQPPVARELCILQLVGSGSWSRSSKVSGSIPGCSSLHAKAFLGNVLNPELLPMHLLECV